MTGNMADSSLSYTHTWNIIAACGLQVWWWCYTSSILGENNLYYTHATTKQLWTHSMFMSTSMRINGCLCSYLCCYDFLHWRDLVYYLFEPEFVGCNTVDDTNRIYEQRCWRFTVVIMIPWCVTMKRCSSWTLRPFSSMLRGFWAPSSWFSCK